MRFSPVPDERFGRNRRQLVQIARSLLRPIEHHHRGRDFGQAADLAFVPWLLLLQDMPGLRIDDDVGAGGVEDAACRANRAREQKEREKSGGNSSG